MNHSIKIVLLLLTLNSQTFLAMGPQGLGQSMDSAAFAEKATKYIMHGELKKLAVMGGILLTTTVVSGVGLRAAIDLYKSTKDTAHRTLWGPTQEDKIIAMELEKAKQFTLEKQQALKMGSVKLEQANLDLYAAIMDKRITRATAPAEKETLIKTCDETLASLAEIAKRRIAGATA